MESLPPELLRMILTPSEHANRPLANRFSATAEVLPQPICPLYVRPTNPFWATHPSYVKLRLVSKTFNAIITPFVFAHLRTESTEASLTRLTSIAEDPHLRHFIKSYEYSFWRETFPPRLAQKYSYIISLPEEAREKGYQRLDSEEDAVRRRIEHYGRQLEFKDLESGHIEAIRKLPNLEKLTISVNPGSSTHLGDVPSRMVKWGPSLLQAFLKVLGERADQEKVKMIREFTVQGLTVDCLLFSPSTFMAGLRGFETLHTITMSVTIIPEPSLSILGRFLQNAKQLRHLTLSRHSDEGLDNFPDMHLRSLFSPARIDRSCQQREPSPPPVARWPHLTSLKLSEMVFTSALLLEFFAHHHRTLQSLELNNCFLKPGGIQQCPHHYHPPSSPTPEQEPDPTKETWQYVFRQLHGIFKRPLEHIHFSRLSAGKDTHAHLSNREAAAWAELLSGKRTDEPVKEESDGAWCAICNPHSESDLEDDGFWDLDDLSSDSDDHDDEDDDDGDIYPLYGMSGYDSWDDDESGSDSDDDEMLDQDMFAPPQLNGNAHGNGMSDHALQAMVQGAIVGLQQALEEGVDVEEAVTSAIRDLENTAELVAEAGGSSSLPGGSEGVVEDEEVSDFPPYW
ncbi:hypothetical protein K440DRAFT_631359 [Wilcoxina mikolae CBS 423.85]|nr:hypothetical protein K440DRAFT_631359 [Wilcoxina mikolae CBS 423.85]